MSTVEIVVGLGGLLAGCWLVSAFIDGSRRRTPPADEDGSTLHKTREAAEAVWWDVLGVTESATDAEVRLAYKRGMALCHPDRVAHLSADMQALANRQAQILNAALADYEAQARKDQP